jgi:hypothetical protein
VLDERSLYSTAQRVVVSLVVQNPRNRAQERALECVLIATVIAVFEVAANLLLAIRIDLIIEVVPNATDDVSARDVFHLV